MDSGLLASLGLGMTKSKEDIMNEAVPLKTLKTQPLNLPKNRDAFYGGKWHKPISGRSTDAINPGTASRSGRWPIAARPISTLR